MNKMFLMLSLSLLSIPMGHSHEGHGVPGSVQAQHGGVIKPTKELYVELVAKGKDVLVYPMNHDLKAVPLSDVKLTGTSKLPRDKKTSAVTFAPMADAKDPSKSHFHGNFDAKGAHRYELTLNLEYQGKKEKVVFQVEPK